MPQPRLPIITTLLLLMLTGWSHSTKADAQAGSESPSLPAKMCQVQTARVQILFFTVWDKVEDRPCSQVNPQGDNDSPVEIEVATNQKWTCQEPDSLLFGAIQWCSGDE